MQIQVEHILRHRFVVLVRAQLQSGLYKGESNQEHLWHKILVEQFALHFRQCPVLVQLFPGGICVDAQESAHRAVLLVKHLCVFVR